MNTYDLAIAYRIYPKISKTPLYYSDNKLSLVELGVTSLIKALAQVRAKIYFLLDNCPNEYEILIRKYYKEEDIEIHHFKGIGNLASFGEQMNILSNQTHSELVFFLEDDYLFKPNSISPLLEFLKKDKVDFVTPYDHIDNYILTIHTQHRYKIDISKSIHWRTCASTCMTFLTKKSILTEADSTLRSYCYGNWDSSLWFALTKHNIYRIDSIRFLFIDKILTKALVLGWIKSWKQILFGRKYSLWQPIPSLATHLESTGIAPVVDWNLVKKQIETDD